MSQTSTHALVSPHHPEHRKVLSAHPLECQRVLSEHVQGNSNARLGVSASESKPTSKECTHIALLCALVPACICNEPKLEIVHD